MKDKGKEKINYWRLKKMKRGSLITGKEKIKKKIRETCSKENIDFENRKSQKIPKVNKEM